MAEIRNALAVGKEIITHTDAVSVPGWSGAGYIIFDPQTGSGAYKIGGGLNGGILFVLAIVLIAAIALFFAGSLILAGSPILGAFIAAIELNAFIGYIDGLNKIDSEELFESFSTFTIITQLVGLIPFIEVLGTAGVPLVIFLEGILLAFEQVWFPV